MKTIICNGCGLGIEQKKFLTHAKICQAYKDWKQALVDKLTYDFLYREYIEEEKSTTQIARELGFNKDREVRKKLKEYNIKERTFAEGRKAKGYIALCQKTSMERYGVPYHTMKESSIREKIDAAVKSKYGVDNVFQLEEVKEKSKQTNLKKRGVEYASQSQEVKDKVKETCLKKFGVSNPSMSEEVKDKIKQTNLKRRGVECSLQDPEVKKKAREAKAGTQGKSSQAEAFFADLANRTKLDAMYKPHSKEFYIRKNKTVVYRYDFTVLSLKKIIEFNGSYWHANPKRYSHDFMISGLTAQEIWDRDEDKRKLAEQQGFKILTVWDDMPYEDMMQQCISFLLC